MYHSFVELVITNKCRKVDTIREGNLFHRDWGISRRVKFLSPIQRAALSHAIWNVVVNMIKGLNYIPWIYLGISLISMADSKVWYTTLWPPLQKSLEYRLQCKTKRPRINSYTEQTSHQHIQHGSGSRSWQIGVVMRKILVVVASLGSLSLICTFFLKDLRQQVPV